MKHSKGFIVQPIINIKTNRVCGGEILYRPNGERLTPEILEELDNDPFLNLEVKRIHL